MSYIKIIYKDEEVNYNGSLQGAIESAFKYEPDKCGYIEVLDGNITENIQLYHGVNLYFANGVTFKGTMTDGGKSLTAIISGNGTLTTFGTGNVFNIQNSNSNIICNCNVIDGSTSAVSQSTLSVFANDGRLSGSSTASSSGSTNLYVGTGHTFNSFSINNIVGGQNSTLSGQNNLIIGQNNSISGSENLISGSINLINGGRYNTVGGYLNSVSSGRNSSGNVNTSDYNNVSGYDNKLVLAGFNIVGGLSNSVSSSTGSDINNYSSYNIVGGNENSIVESRQNIVSGYSNELNRSNYNSVVGLNNSVTALTSIIYGEVNSVTGIDSIVGGAGNSVTGNFLNVFGVNCSVSGHSLLVNGRDNVIRQDDGIINGDGITSTSAYHTNIFGNSIVNTASSATLIGRNFTNSEPNATVFQYGSAKPNFIINNVGATGSRLFVLAAPSQTNEVATKGYVDTVAASGSTGVTSWGSIIGTLSAQTDLVTELALKPNLNTANTYTNGTQTFQNNLLCAGTTFLQTPTTYGSGLTAYPASNWLIRKSFADTEYTLTGSLVTASSNLSSYINNQVSLRVDKYGDTMFNWLTFIPDGSFNPMRPDLAPVASGVAVCYQWTENRYSNTGHNHALANLSEKSYYSLTNKPDLSVTGSKSMFQQQANQTAADTNENNLLIGTVYNQTLPSLSAGTFLKLDMWIKGWSTNSNGTNNNMVLTFRMKLNSSALFTASLSGGVVGGPGLVIGQYDYAKFQGVWYYNGTTLTNIDSEGAFSLTNGYGSTITYGSPTHTGASAQTIYFTSQFSALLNVDTQGVYVNRLNITVGNSFTNISI